MRSILGELSFLESIVGRPVRVNNRVPAHSVVQIFNREQKPGTMSFGVLFLIRLSGQPREFPRRTTHNSASRLRFAVQLCVVRRYGRFLDDYAGVSARIVNFLSRQLDLPPVLAVQPSRREGTQHEHQRRIREYLGLQTFDLPTQEQIERWVCGQAAVGLSPGEIFPHAEETLRLWDVILPARSTLERLVASQAARAQEEIFQRLSARLSAECRADLDSLLEVGEDVPRSALLRLKEYPPEATAASILSYLEQYALLRSLRVERIDLSGLSPELTLQLSALVKRYDAWTLKRFAEPKRHAMLACFLTKAQKTVLDHLAEMHDRLLTRIWGRSQRAYEERHRELRRRAKEGLDQLVAAVEFLLDPCRSRETTLAELCRQVNEEELQAALASCRAFQHLEERGFLDEISSYYSYLRRYFPTLFELPFEAEPGSRSLLEALAIVRRLDRGELGKLPMSAPVDFVPPAWRKFLLRADGLLDRRAWEIALGFALRDALRSGDIYLPESRRHVSFWNLVYDERQWAQERSGAYKQLSLFPEADTVRRKLFQEFDLVARQLDQGLRTGPLGGPSGRRRHRPAKAFRSERSSASHRGLALLNPGQVHGDRRAGSRQFRQISASTADQGYRRLRQPGSAAGWNSPGGSRPN